MSDDCREARKESIRWYKHFKKLQVDHLVAQYRSAVENDDLEPSVAIEQAIEERAPCAKKEIDRLGD